ncbi:MAG: hypothetical protein IPF99_27675 [Deltaproteobacteria bacterium]|nr:hypothetical protein [Deltaproteobacteria bacterium]
MQATEPEAYAAEVCPRASRRTRPSRPSSRSSASRASRSSTSPAEESSTVACGRYRPATLEEESASGCTLVIETLQVAGDDHLGGDYLTPRAAVARPSAPRAPA